MRVDRGEVHVGVISAETKLGDNWCDASKVGHALFLDTFFGVLRDGDKVVFSSARLSPIPLPNALQILSHLLHS